MSERGFISQQITRARYLFKVQWECEIDDAEGPEILAQHIVQ